MTRTGREEAKEEKLECVASARGVASVCITPPQLATVPDKMALLVSGECSSRPANGAHETRREMRGEREHEENTNG